ncbi:GINS complex subunit 4 [Clonorchis sinensis]|uniref:GINS complex subunit 4 n=1 Tax=Clonorchis sinensis TaxID=79923 RepID=G7Y6K4_CLOSI|nr:GINS complex subunit 4 [Clonorchis sinensis]
MDAPLAPDLEEIIGGSDEENEADTELLTPAELLKRLVKRAKSLAIVVIAGDLNTQLDRIGASETRLDGRHGLDPVWQNEKVAPELLGAHPDLLSLVQDETDRLEAQAKSLPAGDLRAQIKRLQVERIRYMITDYMRTRISKVEQFAEHILAEERARPDTEPPHLTAEEFLFAKSYTNSIKEYLKSVIVSRLPANMQTVKDEDLAFHPSPHSYVFCRALSRVSSVVVDEPSGGESQSRTSHTRNAARSALPAHSKSPNWLLGVTEQPGITITSAHQGVSLSTAPIQPLGDASQKISPASRPVNSVGNRTAHAGQQNKPFKSTVAGNSCYTGVWRGPEFVTERLSRWSLSADMLDHVPSSNDVFLSGIILQPGTYLRAKNNVGKPVLIEPDVVFGVIRVHNYTYEKSVTVRATCDRWLTYVDQPAKYVTSYDTSSSVKSKFDTFAFRFPLPDSSEEFEFAIHYRWLTPSGGGSAWDNNGGRNYIIHRKRFEMNKPKVEVTEVLDSVLGVSS